MPATSWFGNDTDIVFPEESCLMPFKPRQYFATEGARGMNEIERSAGGEIGIPVSLELMRQKIPIQFEGPYCSITRLEDVLIKSSDQTAPLAGGLQSLDSGLEALADIIDPIAEKKKRKQDEEKLTKESKKPKRGINLDEPADMFDKDIYRERLKKALK